LNSTKLKLCSKFEVDISKNAFGKRLFGHINRFLGASKIPLTVIGFAICSWVFLSQYYKTHTYFL